MQCRMSRQLVTGLTVNAKVNIRPEYYRYTRAMCHSLFKTGAYHQPLPADPDPITSLYPLEGILSHIHHVKDTIGDRDELKKRTEATAARKLYARFLKYRYFVRLERPLIVCEGKTNSIYLKYAIRNLTAFHPKLGVVERQYLYQCRRVLQLCKQGPPYSRAWQWREQPKILFHKNTLQ